jgi:hypothetical protein
MPKRISKSWRTRDVNQLAHHLVRLSTKIESDPAIESPHNPSPSDISRVMAAMGRRGGKIGGKRRLVTLTPGRRKEIAVKAAKKRWENAKKD